MPRVRLMPLPALISAPVGIDYHEPSGNVLVSVGYPTGTPSNFVLISLDGTQIPFSAVSGFTGEVKIATVRSGAHQGGFTVGEVFTGNGKPGQVVRISPDGTVVQNPWVTLTDPGVVRSQFQDRYGIVGGDLIVVTTRGGVWCVNSEGLPKKVADLGVFLEGVTTVPDLPRYGPWAGKIVIGAEKEGNIHVEHLTAKLGSFPSALARKTS